MINYSSFSLCCKILGSIMVCTVLAAGCGATSVNNVLSKSSNATGATLSTTETVDVPVASEGEKDGNAAASPVASALPGTVDVSWGALLERLHKEAPNAKYDQFFIELEAYSSAPMSIKIKELHGIAFRKNKVIKPSNGTVRVYSSIYKGFVTKETVEKCNAFLLVNKSAFDLMEERYKIPRTTVVALLYVETKLGGYLGKEKAFWSLACMAAADAPEKVNDGIVSLGLKPAQEPWLATKLQEKSNWAYKELKALLNHSINNDLDPQSMPGSVYGAIGICQFMPSNLAPYGDDGNGDGKIDLFNDADAIVSVGKYLSGHGWKGTMAVAEQRKVLKRYNNLNRYANTILSLAASIKTGVLHTKAPDAPGSVSIKAGKVTKPITKKTAKTTTSKAKASK